MTQVRIVLPFSENFVVYFVRIEESPQKQGNSWTIFNSDFDFGFEFFKIQTQQPCFDKMEVD